MAVLHPRLRSGQRGSAFAQRLLPFQKAINPSFHSPVFIPANKPGIATRPWQAFRPRRRQTLTASNPLAAAFEFGVTAQLAFSFIGLGSRENRYKEAESTLETRGCQGVFVGKRRPVVSPISSGHRSSLLPYMANRYIPTVFHKWIKIGGNLVDFSAIFVTDNGDNSYPSIDKVMHGEYCFLSTDVISTCGKLCGKLCLLLVTHEKTYLVAATLLVISVLHSLLAWLLVEKFPAYPRNCGR